jgi:Domain of unknown function (DUF4468) with TBP-like fold
MKYLIVVLFMVTFGLKAFAQQEGPAKLPKAEENPVRIEFYDTVSVATTAKDILFARALKFINENYKHPKEVIKSQNAPLGILEGEAHFDAKGGYPIIYSIKITVGDNWYKYSFYPYAFEETMGSAQVFRTLSVEGSSHFSAKEWTKVSNSILTTINDLVTKLKLVMNTAN